MTIVRRKILAKLIVVLIAVVSLVSAASIIFFNKQNAQMMRGNLRDTMENLREISRLSYALPLWYMNEMEISHLNRALLSNNDIVAVNIYDDTKTFLDGAWKDPETMEIDSRDRGEPFRMPEGKPDIKKLYYTIIHEGMIIGAFEIFYTERYVNEKIVMSNVHVALAILLIGLATTVVIFLVVKRLLIMPVLALADISRDIARNKDQSIKIERRSDDEIGILYESINNMLQNIRANEKELQRTKGYLANIIQSMPSMLVSIDRDGTVTQWNQAAELTLGIPAAQILGKNIWEATGFFSDLKALSEKIMRLKEPVHLYRKRFEHGGVSYKDVSLYPLIENGVNGLVMRIDDMTELEKKEELLRQAQKMETIGTLTSGIAHDFNNILGVIVGTVSLVKYRMALPGGMAQEQLKEKIEAIEKAGKRAADMVQQLLTLSRKRDISFLPVDVAMAMRNVLNICRNTFDKVIDIRVEYAEERAVILGDIVQIEQVLLNLCVNAYHALTMMRKTNAGVGGIIGISCSKIHTDRHFVSQHPEAEFTDYWKVSVQDNGVGMSPATIAKIFDPFFTTKEKGRGTGLGLAVVYNIVRQHSGFLDVYSVPEIGSTFNVYLPCHDMAVPVASQSEEGIRRGAGLILVVDDEPLMREVAKNILEECGYQVITAQDGNTALALFEENLDRISLVLLDIIMPKKSGREVYTELLEIDRDVRVLFASGFRYEEEAEGGPDVESVGLLQKPYTLKALSDAVYKKIYGA
jgi:two-component system cell cycle sensor histidine kinase/response regulator CckA